MTEKLPLPTQTLYAELMEQLTALEAHRSIGHLAGCFTTKSVKGENYYYFQHSQPGEGSHQIYVGRKNPALDKIVKKYETEREAVKADQSHIQQLCAQLRAGRALVTDNPSSKVIKALADGGFFHLNGVLVGTHAFIVLGNMLGVRWKGASQRTQDVDIAGSSHLHIAIPHTPVNIPEILERLQMGFLPIPSLNHKHPSTSFKVRGEELRVDILTPELGARKRGPVSIPHFNTAAQPLPFLDFLIERPEQAAVINGGGILVNIPNPARFAFHKLIVFRERPAIMHSKTKKDLWQATQLFSLLAEERPGDLLLIWNELKQRGRGWVKRVRAGFSAIKKENEETYKNILKILPDGVS